MARPRHAADHTDGTRNDPVRREAYEHAMDLLRGRASLSDALTNDEIREMQQREVPEISGRASDVRRRSKN